MEYSAISGSKIPPTPSEIEAHIGSWWVQKGYTDGYESVHLHTRYDAMRLAQLHNEKLANTRIPPTVWIWRPYYRETGQLRQNWPDAFEKVKTVMASVSAEHDGTGAIQDRNSGAI